MVHIEGSQVFALINTTVNVAIVLQLGEPIALVTNGNTGTSIVINIEKQIIIYYPPGSNGNLWKNSNLLEYLQKLGPLTSIINWKNGQSFKLSSATKQIKDILISIIKHLDHSTEIAVNFYPDTVVSRVSVLINGLLQSQTVLQLLLEKLDTSVTMVNDGLQKFVYLVVGLTDIGNKVNGGIQSLIRNDTNVPLLLGQNSGLTSLLALLLQDGVHVDLTTILGDLLKTPEDFLGLAVHLDRGKYTGFSGLFAAIYNLQLYAVKKISLEALIDVLIQVQVANGFVKITKERLNHIISWYFVIAKSQVSEYNTASSWTTLNTFFQEIKEDKLVTNGINISAIINILISTSGNRSLSNIVKILLYLKPACSLSKIIATLYFRLVCFVITGQGLMFIHILLPNVLANISLSSTTSVLKQILSSVNVFQITSYLLKLDVVGALTHLPILGPILKAVEDATKTVGVAAEVTVVSSLKTTGSIIKILKESILYALGRGGNKGPTEWGIAGLPAVGGGFSVSITNTWTSSEAWTSSNGGPAGPTDSNSQSNGNAGGGHKGSEGFGWSLFS